MVQQKKEWLWDNIKKAGLEISRKEMRERIKIELKIMEEFEREVACRLVG